MTRTRARSAEHADGQRRPPSRPRAASARIDASSRPADRLRRRSRAAPARPERGATAEAAAEPRLKKLRVAFVLLGLAVAGARLLGLRDHDGRRPGPARRSRAAPQYDAAQNSVVLDANGEKLATLTGNEGRILLESDEISPTMKQAVVAIEDERFYEHRGIDFLGIARALVPGRPLRARAQQGGSTITQQFVKNALDAQDSRTVLQKLREAALAYQLERQWSKDKILTEYLNTIYFGEGAYGIEAAARTYFGCEHPGCGEPTSDPLRLAAAAREAALLAGMISSPTAYSPRPNPRERARSAATWCSTKMRRAGLHRARRDDCSSTAGADRRSRPEDIEPPAEDSEAPYFTTGCASRSSTATAPGEAFGGGLQVKSTLDLDLQARPRRSSSSRLARASAHRVRRRARQRDRRRAARWSAATTTRRSRSTSPPTASASRAPRSSRSRW